VLTITPTSDPPGLRLSGDVDASNADQLDHALSPLAARGGDITLDVSQLGFIGSAGMQVLVRALIDVEGKGRIVVTGARAPFTKLVGIMGLDRFTHFQVG
jgi:anti-anti-sigma factor